MTFYFVKDRPIRAPNTNRIQESIHISIAVKPEKRKTAIHLLIHSAFSPSAFGVLVVTVLKMLTRTRKRVTRSAILPGMMSGGTTKLIHDTTTKRPVHSKFPFSTSVITDLKAGSK